MSSLCGEDKDMRRTHLGPLCVLFVSPLQDSLISFISAQQRDVRCSVGAWEILTPSVTGYVQTCLCPGASSSLILLLDYESTSLRRPLKASAPAVRPSNPELHARGGEVGAAAPSAVFSGTWSQLSPEFLWFCAGPHRTRGTT